MTLRCDLVIRNADVADGTGRPRVRADVAVRGDRIAAVGDAGAWQGDRELDATGRVLTPGFIDAHTHHDGAVLCGPHCMRSQTSQGVTTVVVGNCGISLAPVAFTRTPPQPLRGIEGPAGWVFDSFGAYADRLDREPASVNTVALVGHMSLRCGIMGDDLDRPATDKEAEWMRRRLAEALAEGAAGLSTGLFYPPSRHAPTAEVVAVAEALRGTGALYVTHMRDEADGVLDSIEETLGIGAAAGAPVVISHHKCSMPENHGRSAETLPRIERGAQENAGDNAVAFDVYPYAASSTMLTPARARADIPCRVISSAPHPEMAGRMLEDVAREWDTDLRTAMERLVPGSAIYHVMAEDDVRRILAHDLSMVGSDGSALSARPHPRTWGTFPRVLGRYARELGLFTLETAIHKMTGRTAAVFNLQDRGQVREGAYADLVLFDPATVIDRATFDDPALPAEGIDEVWVNGRTAYTPGAGATEERSGRLLRRK